MIKNIETRTSEFTEKSITVHGNKYDYSKVEYVNSKTKVCIVCHKIDEITGEKHNEFWQVPYSHLNGSTCPKCSNHFMSQEIFIKRANVIHNNKYDYSKVEYKAVKTKVSIICPDHGEFEQTTDNHINKKQGCPHCGVIKRTKKQTSNTQEFVEKAIKKHGELYDYSNTKYINAISKVSIHCKIHGEFLQKANDHLNGCGCPLCNK